MEILIYIVIWFFAALIGIGFYVVSAISLYTIAQRKGIEHPYLAWIPIAQDYLFAEIIGKELKVGTTTIPYFPWLYIAVLYAGNIIFSILALIPFFGWIIRLLSIPIMIAIVIYVTYRFFKLFDGGNEVALTILSTIFPVSRPFIFLYLRNKPFVQEPIYNNYAV